MRPGVINFIIAFEPKKIKSHGNTFIDNLIPEIGEF